MDKYFYTPNSKLTLTNSISSCDTNMSFLQSNCTKYPSSPVNKTPSPITKTTQKSVVCSTPSSATISSLARTVSTTSTPINCRIEALNINDSGLCASSLISTSTTNIDTSSLASYDTLFTEADINCLVEALSQNQNEKLTLSHLMRSASSAGETSSRTNPDIYHTSVPKRAETFNGASSSKETNISLNINEISKTRSHKVSTSSSSYINCGSSISSGSSNNDTNITNLNLNTDLSADSGYQSRLCVNQNHELDGDSCVCTCFSDFNNSKNINNDNSQEEPSRATPYKLRLEDLVRYIIKDYVKLKDENTSLKEDLENKQKTIELLQQKVDSIKVK